MTQLHTTTVGTMLLRIQRSGSGDWTEVAAALVSMSIALNESPGMTAMVPIGTPVAGDNEAAKLKNGADDVLALVNELQTSAAATSGDTLHACEMYEVGANSRVKIFKGYVANCSLEASTIGKFSLNAVFFCVGLTGPLLASPVSGYIEANMGALINRLTAKTLLNLEAAKASNLSEMAGDLGIEEFAEELVGVDIVGKVAKAVSAIRRIGMIFALKDVREKGCGTSKAVLDAFGGNLALNVDGRESGLDNNCDYAYGEQLLMSMMTAMSGGSILNAIRGVLTSYDYCLQLCPRWSCDKTNDFKTEITPCSAWTDSRKERMVSLKASDVLSIKVVTDMTNAMATPDVLFVTFQDACGFYNGSTDNIAGDVPMGVFARDVKLNAKLRQMLATRALDKSLQADALTKVLEARAPQWLAMVNARKEASTADEQKRNLEKDKGCEKQPEKPDDERVAEATAGEKSSIISPKKTGDGSVASDTACMYAQALFQFLYRKESMCTVMLSPSIRFCGGDGKTGPCLENHIGDTVSIDLSDAADYVKGVKLYGVLAGLRVEYKTGDSSMLQYIATLERVRLSTADWIDKDCPIYKNGVGKTAAQRDDELRKAEEERQRRQQEKDNKDAPPKEDWIDDWAPGYL